MDLEKYRRLFVEEANDHMIEMSGALTALEGGPSRQAADEAIDTLFRMAHSIKGMAASLDYDSVSALSHRFEDWMEPLRGSGGQPDDSALALISRVLHGLEQMVAAVDSTGEAPQARVDLVELLAEPPSLAPMCPLPEDSGKKARIYPHLPFRDRYVCGPRSLIASWLRWAS